MRLIVKLNEEQDMVKYLSDYPIEYLIGMLADQNEAFTIDDLGNRDNVNLRDTTDVNYVIDNLTNRC